MLAKHALQQALRQRLLKVVAEIVAAQEPANAMFSRLSFDVEALLYDHIRDHQGHLQDVLILAHHVADQCSKMTAAGVGTDLRRP